MGKIFLVVACGFFAGFFHLVKGEGLKWNSRLQTFWLVLLIFCMGVSIGRNAEVIRNLPILGGRAALFSILAVAGSVIAVSIVSRLFLKGDSK